MSSSTFSSEAEIDQAERPGWRRWLIVFFATLFTTLIALYLLVLLLDPFSTGRFTPIERVDIATRMSQYANAGRVRDPQFDSAVVGNSHAIRINPEILSGATGHRLVLLAALGMFPTASIVVARAFNRHHRPGPAAIVLVLDQFWCIAPGETSFRPSPFPDWLYDTDGLAYLRHILSPRAVQVSLARAAILLGISQGAANAHGYDARPGYFGNPRIGRAFVNRPRPSSGPPLDAPYPAIDALESFVAEIAAGTKLLLVFPPVHISVVPLAGSAAEKRFDGCKARVHRIAAARPATAVVDMRTDSALSRDAENFFDPTHYSEPAARIVAQEIAGALGSLSAQ